LTLIDGEVPAAAFAKLSSIFTFAALAATAAPEAVGWIVGWLGMQPGASFFFVGREVF